MNDNRVRPGYTLDRDDNGLTAKEQHMMALLVEGKGVSLAAASMGLSRQRGSQLAQSLVRKGAMKKKGQRYVAAV